MKQYLDLMNDVYTNGSSRMDRTGTGIRSVFGRQMRFDLQQGFPMVTTKKVHWKSVVYELLWFLTGDTNVKFLQDNGVRIWNEWADDDGCLGPVYGKQWRSWQSNDGQVIDQVATAIQQIKENPNSRRILVNAWNVGELENMALPPCHMMFQFFVDNNKLSCQLYQRSCDVFLGLPFNIASYSLLTYLFAQQTGLEVGEFVWTGGDVHIYDNHLEQVQLQLTREPYPLPTLSILRHPDSIDDYQFEDFQLTNYHHHPPIKAPVAV